MELLMSATSPFYRAYGDTNFITGLRAIAATMVVIVHTGAFMDLGLIGVASTEVGKYGVDIFFVISGFTIAKTFTDAKDYQSYLTRRIMRIVPLYWAIISVAMLIWVSGQFGDNYWMDRFGAKPDLYNYFLHISMISYLDYSIANSLLGVEWSIPVEVFWYIFLPPLLFLGRTVPRTVGVVLILAILTAGLSYISKKTIGTSYPIKWSPIAYGHLFFIGVLSFFMRSKFKDMNPTYPKVWISAAIAMFLVPFMITMNGRGEILALATAILIIFVTPSRAGLFTNILTFKPMLYLGSISYSIYLIHPLVIHMLSIYDVSFDTDFFNFLTVYLITVFLASGTYVLIERPANLLGRKLAERSPFRP